MVISLFPAPSLSDGHGFAAQAARVGRDRHITSSASVPEMPRYDCSGLGNVLRDPLGDDLTTTAASFGSQVDDPVDGLDHIEVVLDDDHGVALVHQ